MKDKKLRRLLEPGVAKPPCPFTGTEATPAKLKAHPGFSNLMEQEFLARQAADPQHMTMSEMRASLGAGPPVHTVDETPGKRPFSGPLTFSGSERRPEPLDPDKFPGAHLRHQPTIGGELFEVVGTGGEAPAHEIDVLWDALD